ncbi:DegT/DnrJ/EryC1/StrS family aminotransferase [Lignipirellula cremea]|uniref:UDP-2-acetamido-2-deoxy-3-oxo-D-glucuronate aminotransferase n=1 Tax=Lignipirellula cremea TaxID=2528010 RepID=A0A518E4K8_9BACT|nr:DegT/DnrJ/EryC1/StrS family aminotransferase [Lignipirellula cremea]QDU99031.1 UDP-2-acetamido-2-deoxy-3-oxo-D-glucuronate aminotransferase [Lignipirellula cremea]
MIPLCDLTRSYQTLKAEIDAAMQSVAEKGHFILGPNAKAFEQEIADFCGCRYAVGVNSGTDALHLALRALKIGPGDEVITTPFTFVATTEAIGIVGARPVFVDIDPRTFNLDPNQIEDAITPRTKAILPVHLYGQPCSIDAVMEIAERRQLRVVEDCAQSLGAAYHGRQTGTFGDAGCLSFFPSKNLGCFGDGGMLITNDTDVYERAEMLRRHGGRVKYHHEELGLNSRLDELQAAILRVKLPHLHAWNQKRRQHAYHYNHLLQDCPTVVPPAEWTEAGTTVPRSAGETTPDVLQAVYHQYTVQVENRDAVMQRLTEQQVGNAVYYPVPLHLQQVHADLQLGRGSFPHAERAAECCLSLPMFPELTEKQQQTVIAELKQAAAPAARRAG